MGKFTDKSLKNNIRSKTLTLFILSYQQKKSQKL